ncbi:MAG: class I SAM-dependent methyltransferase [Hyphomicrobiaceae bacterium]
MATSTDDAALVRRFCLLGTAPLVPEVPLYLARHSLDIWQGIELSVIDVAARRPYWAFAWPGGQAKARFLIDNPGEVAGKRVLDIGAGSGIGAIAALRAGAHSAIANDIDPLALSAIALNAAANGCEVELAGTDLLAGDLLGADVVLLSDVVYEPELSTRVARFIETAAAAGASILYADRATARLPLPPRARLATYDAQVFPALEATHFEQGIVWRLA